MSILKPVLLTLVLASLSAGLSAPAIAAAPQDGEVTAAPGFPEPGVRRWQTGLLRADRIQHTMFSLSAGLMIGLTSEEPLAAAGGAMAFGIAKELWDARAGRFDTLDLLADALGAAGAYATTVTLTR